MMWDRMAEISFKHLKPNDLICVSGHLEYYTKADDKGELRPSYKVDNQSFFTKYSILFKFSSLKFSDKLTWYICSVR